MNKDITICLMTCGEETESQCKKSLEAFGDNVVFQEVRNQTPQVVALNQMIQQTKTEFLIPVDSDMVLDEDAWPRIKNAINKHRHKPEWHSLLFSLWDVLTERKILALKILRSDIMKQNLFSDTATPDVEHYERLTSQGYSCIHDYIRQKPIGKHVVQGHHYCYHKYRDVYMTLRNHDCEWDSGVFLGGNTLRERAKNHFDFFVFKFVTTDNRDYLSCIAGMMDGIMSSLETTCKDLSKTYTLVHPDEAISTFFDWYLNDHRFFYQNLI